MKLILHIGTTKTGTSAIQLFMWKWRDLLFDKYNILYPKTGIFFGAGPAHYKFTWFYFKDLKKRIKHPQILNEFKSKYKSSQQIIEELINEINFASKFPNAVILSSENYFVINPLLLAPDYFTFSDRLPLSKLVVVVYLRRQDKWLEAVYSQHVKGGHFKEFHELQQVYMKKRRDLYYNDLLAIWHQAFPNSQIIPLIYDRSLFPESNVILDFLSVLGIDMPEAKKQKIEVNPSLSVVSAMVLRKINESFNLTLSDHRRVISYLIKCDEKESIPIKTFFTLSERIAFLDHFRESNEKLFKEWFGIENKFVLSDEEIEFYEEQDRISKNDLIKIVEERYEKTLKFLKEQVQ